MPISRRRLFLGLAGLFVLPMGAHVAWGRSSEQLIRFVVEKRLGSKVLIDDASFSTFVDEFLQNYSEVESTKWAVLRSLAPVYRYSDVLSKSPLSDAVWWLERDILHEYLLGTDYFFHETFPNNKPLVYRGAYRPGHQPCRNPFARFDLDPEAV